jgi:hypothetical protein
MELTGLHITGITRRKNSVNGNPRFDVAFVDRDGQPHVYTTMSDAACSYDVENLAGEHRRDLAATVAVKLTRAERISTMTRES